jgi:hypothetical protein
MTKSLVFSLFASLSARNGHIEHGFYLEERNLPLLTPADKLGDACVCRGLYSRNYPGGGNISQSHLGEKYEKGKKKRGKMKDNK